MTQIAEELKRANDPRERVTVCSPEDFGDRCKGNLGDGFGPIFDDLATHVFMADNDLSELIVLGGGGASLTLMRQARIMEPVGTRCGTLWFSSHWAHADRVLREEYVKYGVKADPIHSFVKWRAGREQEESDFMIVPSQFCKGTYPESLQARMYVAEFGVDSTLFNPAQSRPQEGNALRVLVPASNPMRKGLTYVVQALRDVPDVQVTVTGDLSVDGLKNFSWPGWVDDKVLPDLYRSHDVVLLPSLEEGQALASLEAMATGLPIVVTPNVGIPITDGDQGFVVEPRNSQQIRERIEALKDDALRATMGRAGRKFAEERTWEKFGDRVREILCKEANMC